MPVPQHQDPGSNSLESGKVVRSDEDRTTTRSKLRDLSPQTPGDERIYAAQHFVQSEDRLAAHRRRGQTQPLHHPARILVYAARDKRLEVSKVNRPLQQRSSRCRMTGPVAGQVLEPFEPGQFGRSNGWIRRVSNRPPRG